MKKFLFLFTVIAALMNFTSCSNGDNPIDVVDPDKPVEIKVSGRALDVVAGTRASFEGITASNKLLAKVMASETSSKYGTADVLHNSTMEFGPTDPVGFDTPKAFPHATTPVYLVGLYPSTTWSAVANDNETSFTFTGIEDVMASTEVETVKNDVADDNHKSLTFHHLLTRLNLTIKAKDANAEEAWGEVTSLQVVSPGNVATVELGTGSESPSSVAPTTVITGGDKVFTFCTIGTDTPFCSTGSPYAWPTTAPTTAQSYALVAPQNNTVTPATPIVYTINIKTKKYSTEDRVVSVPLKVSTGGNDFVGNTAGHEFEVVLTFTASNIEAKATVKPWASGGNGDVDVN